MALKKSVQGGMSILTANQDLKGCVHIPNALQSEYEKWKDALNTCTEIAVTGASLWASTDDRQTTVGPNATEVAKYRKGIIRYKDGKEATRFEGKMSAKEVAKIEAVTGKIGTREIDSVIVM